MRFIYLFLTSVVLWIGGLLMAHAEQPKQITLAGSIGKSAVVMELSTLDANMVLGRYFFNEGQTDIALEGRMSDEGVFDLRETEHGSAKLLLAPTENNGWKGTWHSDLKDQTLPVTLLPVQLAKEIVNESAYWQKLRQSSIYDYLRLTKIELKKERLENFMDYELQWLVEPVSGMKLFEITTGYAPETLMLINQRLRDRLWSDIVDYHNCMFGSSMTSAGKGDFTQTVKATFFSAKVISVSIFTNYSCGGAHPDFNNSPLNLNVKTGNQLTLEEVLWLGQKGMPFYYQAEGYSDNVSFEDYAKYREKTLAPWLVKQFKQLYPQKMKTSSLLYGDCDYSDPEVWQFVSWFFSERGLYIGPSFARAERTCEYPDWSILPYEKIREYQGSFSFW